MHVRARLSEGVIAGARELTHSRNNRFVVIDRAPSKRHNHKREKETLRSEHFCACLRDCKSLSFFSLYKDFRFRSNGGWIKNKIKFSYMRLLAAECARNLQRGWVSHISHSEREERQKEWKRALLQSLVDQRKKANWQTSKDYGEITKYSCSVLIQSLLNRLHFLVVLYFLVSFPRCSILPCFGTCCLEQHLYSIAYN